MRIAIKIFITIMLLIAMAPLAACLSSKDVSSKDIRSGQGASSTNFDTSSNENLESIAEPEKITPEDIIALDAGTVLKDEALDAATIEGCFVSVPISSDVFNQINGKSYREISGLTLDDLRYIKVIHYNFEHRIQVGEMIVDAELEPAYLQAFKELFMAEYEIYSMYLVDRYWTGDAITTDDASMAANNTSAFSVREISPGGSMSKHAYGRAIDINPLQNPFVSYSGGNANVAPPEGLPFVDRSIAQKHMITHEDVCFEIFSRLGFTWGGDWYSPKDYQHFEI